MSEMTRDRAIEILRDDASGASFWELAEAVEMGIKALEEQRPHGEWIDYQDEEYSYFANCSICGYQMNTHEEHGYFSFCPKCGADMIPKEGNENEQTTD